MAQRPMDMWKNPFGFTSENPFGINSEGGNALDPSLTRPTDTQPWVPGSGFGGGVNDPNDPFAGIFDAMNLPSYTGPMAAPITEGMFSALQGIKNTTNANPIGMSQDVMNSISAMLGGEGFAAGGMDPNQVMSQFRPNVAGLDEAAASGFQTMQNFNPSDLSGLLNSLNAIKANDPGTSDFGRVTGTIDSIKEGVAPTDLSKSNALLDAIVSGAANNNVDPRMRALQDNVMSSFSTALEAPRFDNTQIFNDLKTVFESDLADQTAELQEQFSSLGLAPGSTDRLNKIASNAGNARARFGAAMGDIASRSFESAEARRLGAINSAGGVGDLLQTGTQNALAAIQGIMSNERVPFEEKMRQRDQLLATLPAEIQAAVIPIQQELEARGQDISMLPIEMQAATRGFDEQMDFVRNVLDPAANRRMTAVGMNANLADSAMDRYMQERSMAENARQAAVSASLAARGQDIDQQGQQMQGANNLFNAETLLRGTADEEVMRNYEEFVRTQGGGLEQMLAFLNALPEGTVAVGPSTASQVGSVAGQIPWEKVWDGVQWVWRQATSGGGSGGIPAGASTGNTYA